MNAASLIGHYIDRGVRFHLVGESIRVDAPAGLLTNSDRDALRLCRDGIRYQLRMRKQAEALLREFHERDIRLDTINGRVVIEYKAHQTPRGSDYGRVAALEPELMSLMEEEHGE